MKSSRKSHRKSRTGCGNCRARKIKCNEKKPACQNCINHSVPCDIPQPQRYTSASTPEDHSVYSNTTSKSSPHVSDISNTFGNHSSGQIEIQTASLNIADLELLHNYSTLTCYTLHSEPILQTLWRISVPQLGFSHHYVMNGILALSALHLAYCSPKRKDFYISQAMLQHQTGLRDVAPILADITPQNCHAVYIFSALISIFALASPRTTGPSLVVAESGFAELLFLMRGTRSVIESSVDHLNSGIFAPMFQAGLHRSQLREATTAQPSKLGPLRALQKLIDKRVTHQPTLLAYTTAIDELQKSFAVVYTPGLQPYEAADVFVWFFRLSDDYLSLLRGYAQEALAIFAYFCVVPKRLESNWWLEGWSSHVMTQIYNLLDQEHRLWIRWPIEQIGWIQP